MSNSIYEALDPNGGIRLLFLEPGGDNARISCRLILHNINSSPDYNALSYEWGSQEIKKAIDLNGQDFHVGENLWWALWHLRKSGEATKLWVDALCINQQDEKERGHQVSMMGRIYKNSDVICWLGKGDDPKHVKAMEHICDWIFLCKQFDDNQRATLQSHGNSSDYPGHMASSQSHSNDKRVAGILNAASTSQARTIPKSGVTSMLYNDDSYLATPSHFAEIEAICSHSYWRRTWIIQEFVLAKSIRIRLGSWEIGHEDFQQATEQVLLQRLSSRGLQLINSFKIFYLREDRLIGHHLPLIRLIELSEHSSCKDLRDRIYAMLGLASDCQNNEIVPDYSKPLSEVYQDVVHRHFYPSDLDRFGHSWSTVHASCLIQRVLWRTSEGISKDPRNSFDTQDMYTTLLSIHGKSFGTVRELSVPGTGMWWAHAGLVKPISSEAPINQGDPNKPGRIEADSVEANHGIRSIFSWPSWPWSLWTSKADTEQALVPKPTGTSTMRAYTGNRLKCYVPGCTRPGDRICRFVNSSTVAVLRLAGESTTLVGRGMILNDSGDVDIYLEGEDGKSDNFTNAMFNRERPVLSFELTPQELKDLTSPHY